MSLDSRTRPALASALLVLGNAVLPWQSGAAQATAPQPDTTAAKQRIIALPALGSAPETGFQFGATLFVVREPPAAWHARPASIKAFALFTAEKQQRVGVESEWWTRDNRWQLAGTAVWQRFPLPYYGVGDQAPKGAKEIFTPRGPEFTATVGRRVARATYVTAGVRWMQNDLTTSDTSGVLRFGTIPGSHGGQTSQVTFGVSNDTRDNLFAPAAGHWLQATWSWSDPALGSDFAFSRLRFDARQYVALHHRQVIAMQAQVVGTAGAPPFDQLALVGGADITRGYERGRYRDRWMAATQAEYRTPVKGRLGANVFAGAAMVAPETGKLLNGQLLASVGGGLRWQLDRRQRTSVRVDYARGIRGASGLYIGFNEAF